MNRSKRALAVALMLLSVPVLLAAMETIKYHVANRSNGSMVSSGQQREYLLYVPASYDAGKPTPLVISLHGAGLWGAAQKETSQWNRAADREGFIVVYPTGLKGHGPTIWSVEPSDQLAKDIRFISELIDTLRSGYNIDPARIFANGASNGGGMSFVLSCTLSDRIAAVGMVAAAQTLPWIWCQDRRPVPMIAVHGTADPVTPYHGGRTWISTRGFPSIPAWTANWARRNQCDKNPVDQRVAVDVTRREYVRCANDADVVLYTVHGGGHSWPGGKPLPEWLVGRNSNTIDATELMRGFFMAHPLMQ